MTPGTQHDWTAAPLVALDLEGSAAIAAIRCSSPPSATSRAARPRWRSAWGSTARS
jgi:hypothetical protein